MTRRAPAGSLSTATPEYRRAAAAVRALGEALAAPIQRTEEGEADYWRRLGRAWGEAGEALLVYGLGRGEG